MSGSRKWWREMLESRDVQVFSGAISNFFGNTTRSPASVRSSYLAEQAQVLPKADFSGMVELTGRYRGWVCFSASRGLLSQVLMAMGLGSDYSDAGHLDLVGEIANTMIGQALRHFGDDLEISVPKTFSGNASRLVSESRSRPVLLPMTWNGYEAVLAIHMSHASDTAA